MNKSKLARRLCSAALASALVIALSSCSGATNTYGKLEDKKDAIYASSNGENVTYGELWDELQWSSESVLEEQITNVVLQKYFNNIFFFPWNIINNINISKNTFLIRIINSRIKNIRNIKIIIIMDVYFNTINIFRKFHSIKKEKYNLSM